MSFLSSRRKSRETIGVASALALVLSPLAVAASAAPAAADDPEVEVVLSTDFEDASWEDVWQKSNESVTVVEDGDGHVLQVADREADYIGIETKLGALELEHDVVYNISARAKLAETVEADSLNMRFVRKPGYAWLPDGGVPVTHEWTEISTSFSLPPSVNLADLALYVGSEALNPTSAEDPGDPYTYFIDDILITKAVEGPVTLLSSDFEDGETAPWQARGDGVLIAVTDADGHESDRSLLVSGRSDGWHGVQTPINGLFEEGKTYQVSAWVKLAEGEDP